VWCGWALVATAGCSGGGGGGVGDATTAAATTCVGVGSPGSATITARDDHFDPAWVGAAPGSTVRLVVRNAGHHPHNLTLGDGSGAHVAVDRGQAAFLTAVVGTTDTAFTCTIHPGMRGVLRVAGGGRP
jgi:plastocyanin